MYGDNHRDHFTDNPLKSPERKHEMVIDLNMIKTYQKKIGQFLKIYQVQFTRATKWSSVIKNQGGGNFVKRF